MRCLLMLLVMLVTACGTPPVVGKAPPPGLGTTVALPAWDSAVPGLDVPVPEGYSARTEKGRDFDIHFLNPSSPSEALGSIYVGHNPGLLQRQIEVRGKVAEHRETINGESVQVYEFLIDGPRTVREAILTTVYADTPDDKKTKELRVHISVTGSTHENVETLWKYISRVHSSRRTIR
jgi:hypothetical protein